MRLKKKKFVKYCRDSPLPKDVEDNIVDFIEEHVTGEFKKDKKIDYLKIVKWGGIILFIVTNFSDLTLNDLFTLLFALG